ncbi:MAG: internal scaffolding protein [Microviridae sp.]|nr:MAG: internal scaffolding protein [Microviridae sp.]
MFRRGKVSPLSFSDKTVISNRSKTHQSFSKDADINNLMSRYKRTGYFNDPLSVNASRVARFGDFSDIPEFSTLVDRISLAKADFMRLPASVRDRFGNDVSKCLDFIADPANFDEAVALELLPAKPVVPVVSDPVKGAVPVATPTPLKAA